jgi:putative salt-induced outer membrane protein YdiY
MDATPVDGAACSIETPRVMTVTRTLCAMLLLIGAGRAAEADVVVLANGDRITGTFQSVRGTMLTMQAGPLGNLSIPVSQISSIALGEPVTVVVHGGAIVHGDIALEPSHVWDVTGDDGVAHTIAVSTVDVILPAARFQAMVDHVAEPWQDWTGTANLGYSIQRGNQETNTFSSSVDSRRERPPAPVFAPHWRTNVHLTMLLSNAIEAGTSIGSNTVSSSVRQDLFFAPGAFVFGIVQFDHVGTEGLSLRQTYGGGSGFDLPLTPRGTFSVFGGLTFVRESFSESAAQTAVDQANGTSRADTGQPSAQLLIGEKLRYQLTPRVRLDHTANAYPNVTIVGQYHLDTRSAVDVKLTNRFSLNTSLIDLYLSNPAPGGRRNNFALTTGIATTF